MGGVAKTAKKIVSNPIRSSLNYISGGAYEAARKNLPKNPITATDKRMEGALGLSPEEQQQVSGPFKFNAAQAALDEQNINRLGNEQYGATQKFIEEDQASRKNARDRLSESLIKQSQDSFQQGLPGTLEDLNARHLLGGSGVGQEIGRQQGQIATNIANQVGVAGMGDIDAISQQRAAALGGMQGFQTSALQRGLSMRDFIDQANVSKEIGAQMAPQAPSGKASGLSGGVAGAGAGAPFGPWGAAIGGGLGLLMGSQANKKGGK